MSKPILFTNAKSACSWRVRTALNLKGVEYESKPVDLVTWKGPNAEECTSLNPARRIPVLVHNGEALAESLAIIEYIDQVFPGPSLLPECPVKRATSRAIALHIACAIQPIQVGRVLNKAGKTDEEKKKWAQHFVSEGLRELEKMVEKSAGKFAVGDEVSIADVCIPSILSIGRKWSIDLSCMPTLLRLEDTLNKISAFATALPENQPDAPKK